MTIRGWDQSWGYADPAKAAALGFKAVSGYLSHDPSKNLTIADVRAYHKAGIAVLFNWESMPGRPLLGAMAGRADALAAMAQLDSLIAGVGYKPPARLSIYFSCDKDVSIAQFPQIDAYYAAAKTVLGARYGVGCYGEFDLVQHLHAKGLTVSEWQTLAWSYGKVSPEADFYQSAINRTLAGASVDFDEVLHPLTLGAWWPPGHEPTPAVKEFSMTPAEEVKIKGWIDARADVTDKAIAALDRRLSSAFASSDGKPHRLRTWLNAISGKNVDIVPPKP